MNCGKSGAEVKLEMKSKNIFLLFDISCIARTKSGAELNLKGKVTIYFFRFIARTKVAQKLKLGMDCNYIVRNAIFYSEFYFYF
jgi:hypothetical protein